MNSSPQKASQRTNRRRFLQTTAVTALASRWAMAGDSPGDAIRCGVIGVGRRGSHLLNLLTQVPAVVIPAVCDIKADRLARAVELVKQRSGESPDGYGERGPEDYRRLLERKDIDAVVIATPMPDHGPMSVASLQAGKAVLSEVAAAMTVEECWQLLHAVEKTGCFYMLSENVCYFRDIMAISRMVQEGLFGRLTYGECGYVHDCRFLHYEPDGSLSWRGEMARDLIGNTYPTHSLGPMAQWMGINRTDRFVSLVAMTTPSLGAHRYAVEKFGPDSAQAKIKFRHGDSTSVLLKTARGAVVDLRYDTTSSRPHRTTIYHTLQGETGSYRSVTNEIWLAKRSEAYKWEPFDKYREEFDHPLWREQADAASGSGHGGADYFTVRAFFNALRADQPSPVDVYDAAAWSAVIGLSADSIRRGSQPVPFPNFTKNSGRAIPSESKEAS